MTTSTTNPTVSRTDEIPRLGHHVAGTWLTQEDPAFATVSPSTGEVVAIVPSADAEIVDRAVAAARSAGTDGPWARTSGKERATAILAIADVLDEHELALGTLIARDMGKAIKWARREVTGSADKLRYFAGLARQLEGRMTASTIPELFDFEYPEPIGVCALIIPWNDPVDLAIRKLGPALAAGCTAVIKPPELAPAATTEFVRLVAERDILPPGVLNLVNGVGELTGELLVGHPGVDKVSFTGSTATGRRILEQASRNLTKVTLECGGKAPVIVFPDCDLERALTVLSWSSFMLGGQFCTACTRLIVHEDLYDAFVSELVARAAALPNGDPLDPGTLIGPIVSREQLDKIIEYVRVATAAGGRVLTGGIPAPGRGLYMDPTVIVDVPVSCPAWQEEIFGPVVIVQRFRDEREALDLANGTPYGLAAGVFTSDINRALRVTRALEFGDVWVNTYQVRNVETSFGGRKMSGFGRELGINGLYEFVEWKRVCIDTRQPWHIKDWFESPAD